MPDPSYSPEALTTWEAVSAAAPGVLEEDAEAVVRLIEAVSATVARWARRPFAFLEEAEELHAGWGQPTIRLRRSPIVDPDSVAVALEGRPLTGWTIEDLERGILALPGGWPYTGGYDRGPAVTSRDGRPRRLIRVTFAGGYVTPPQAGEELPRTLPVDLEEAVILEVLARYRRRGNDPGIQSERLGQDYSVKYAAPAPGGGAFLLPSTAAALAPYRRAPR